MKSHRMIQTTTIATALAVITFAASTSLAGPSAEDKCQAGKSKLAGSYLACREKAEAAAVIKGGAPDFSKCTGTFGEKWDDAENKVVAACPDNVTTTPMQAYLDAKATEVAAIISGAQGIPTCGDGVVNAVGEHCDGTDTDGYTCADFGFAAGTLLCTAGCDFNRVACNQCTGLMYSGKCFFFGDYGQSCDQACAAQGKVYDAATLTTAGSGAGDNGTNCSDLLDQLNAPGPSDATATTCASGFGCAVNLTTPLWCNSPATTSTASNANVARVCACH
ncbi:MAG TPA: hypothetical protein VN634_02560 [Candidatus Limnocylindrales bacterium]|nr:hypothetical protein [Candidatus Limnocylindrales bacterium]